MAGARETSCFGTPKTTFRDRCKGSELFFYLVVIVEEIRFRHRCSESRLLDMWLDCSFRRMPQHSVTLDVQISWQVQHFVNLEVQISWQVQHLVNLEVQISWQAQRLVNVRDFLQK